MEKTILIKTTVVFFISLAMGTFFFFLSDTAFAREADANRKKLAKFELPVPITQAVYQINNLVQEEPKIITGESIGKRQASVSKERFIVREFFPSTISVSDLPTGVVLIVVLALLFFIFLYRVFISGIF